MLLLSMSGDEKQKLTIAFPTSYNGGDVGEKGMRVHNVLVTTGMSFSMSSLLLPNSENEKKSKRRYKFLTANKIIHKLIK
jgi:hypothetical protein